MTLTEKPTATLSQDAVAIALRDSIDAVRDAVERNKWTRASVDLAVLIEINGRADRCLTPSSGIRSAASARPGSSGTSPPGRSGRRDRPSPSTATRPARRRHRPSPTTTTTSTASPRRPRRPTSAASAITTATATSASASSARAQNGRPATIRETDDLPARRPRRRAASACPRCDGALEDLLLNEPLEDDVFVCRNPEHTLPLLVRTSPSAGQPGNRTRRQVDDRVARRLARADDRPRGRGLRDHPHRAARARRGSATTSALATSPSRPARSPARASGPDDRGALAAEFRALAWEITYRGGEVDRERVRRLADRAARMFGEYQRSSAEWAPRAGDEPPGPRRLRADPRTEAEAAAVAGIVPILVNDDLPPNVIGVEAEDGELVASIDYAAATYDDLDESGIDGIAAPARSLTVAAAPSSASVTATSTLDPTRSAWRPASSRPARSARPGRPILDVPCGACSCGWHGRYGHPTHDLSGTHRWAQHLRSRRPRQRVQGDRPLDRGRGQRPAAARMIDPLTATDGEVVDALRNGHQTSLFEPTLAERYAAWRATEAGRIVYHEAHLRALQLRRRGLEHYGIAAIVEAIRYDRAVEMGEERRRLPDQRRSPRIPGPQLIAADDRLTGFFRTR